jgi:indolepyruvate decarboxylase
MGRQEVTEYVEGGDCLIMLGVFMTDVSLGIFTAQLDPARSSAPPASASIATTPTRHRLGDFLPRSSPPASATPAHPHPPTPRSASPCPTSR